MNDLNADVRLAKQGSSEAFARLYSTVYKDMYHIALYSLRSSYDASVIPYWTHSVQLRNFVILNVSEAG